MRDLDMQALRADTPGCATVTHFNHASSSLPSRETLRQVYGQLEEEALRGPAEAGLAAAQQVQDTRAAAARLIGARVEEIALVGSGSQAWGSAFGALPDLEPGDRILVGRHEWGGNLSTLMAAARRAGARVDIMPEAADGTVCPAGLAGMIDGHVRLIALTWLPANSGLINPAAAVGRIARQAGVPFFLDAAQALGQIPIDVAALDCDVLAAPGRKYLRGPRGTAILYVRRPFLERLTPRSLNVLAASWTPDGPALRQDARRFETSENPFALQLGLKAAIEQALAIGIDRLSARIRALAGLLRSRLRDVPGLWLPDQGADLSGLVVFTLAGREPPAIVGALAAQGINIASVPAGYTPLDMQRRGLPAICRASVSHLNTEADIDRLARALEGIATGRDRTGA